MIRHASAIKLVRHTPEKTSGLAVPVVLVAIVELAALVVLVVRVVN